MTYLQDGGAVKMTRVEIRWQMPSSLVHFYALWHDEFAVHAARAIIEYAKRHKFPLPEFFGENRVLIPIEEILAMEVPPAEDDPLTIPAVTVSGLG